MGLDTMWHIVVVTKELRVARIPSLFSFQPVPRLYLTRHFTDPRRLYRFASERII